MSLVDKQCRETAYLTPPRILDPVRTYFDGPIGLDPCTEPGNPTGADVFFDGENFDGLEESWRGHGGVFVNPPYGRELRRWVTKMENEVSRDLNPPELITLLPGQRFEQLYWQRFVFCSALTAFCMVRKRVNFLRPNGTVAKGNPYGSFIYLYNGNWRTFCDAFGDIGLCVWAREIHTRVKE